jgi:hypothetical protein
MVALTAYKTLSGGAWANVGTGFVFGATALQWRLSLSNDKLKPWTGHFAKQWIGIQIKWAAPGVSQAQGYP